MIFRIAKLITDSKDHLIAYMDCRLHRLRMSWLFEHPLCNCRVDYTADENGFHPTINLVAK